MKPACRAFSPLMRLALLCLLLGVNVAAATPLTVDRAIVVGRVDDAAWTDAATEARLDQKAELAAVVVAHRGKQRVVLVPEGVTQLKLGGRKVAVKELAHLEAKTIRWSTVEPHGFRENEAQNGATSDFYSNVSTEAKTFGHWLGYDHIDYFEHVFAENGAPIISAEIKPSEAGAMQVPKLGTTGDVMLVDLSKMLLGDRLALQVEVSPHVLFAQNQIMWRVIQRWDAQPWLNAPIILGDGAGTSTVSPIVVLGGT